MTSQLVTLQVRRGTEAGSTGWFQLNPRLTAGEPGFASDTGVLKIGNGSSLWNDLPSINGFTFSGPSGSVLYYNGTSVTGTTGLQYSAGVGMTMDVLSIRGLNTSVAIGQDAGSTGGGSIAIGPQAGQGQLTNAIAIGNGAGQLSQASAAISIGALSGNAGQKSNAIAIGPYAGNLNQGAGSIAIGKLAGSSGQAANTIILNASGSALDGGGQTGCFYVAPVRSDPTQTTPLCYNPVTYEIVRGNPFGAGFTFTGSTGSVLYYDGNSVTGTAGVTAGYILSSGAGRQVQWIAPSGASGISFSGPTGSVLYYDGNSVTGSTGILGISGPNLTTSLSIVPIGDVSLGSSGSTWSALYADSIIDSTGSSGAASQVLTAGTGGVLTWASAAVGVVAFSGPTGSVLYYDGSSVTGSTGILGISGPDLTTSLSIVPIGDVSLGSSGSTWSALYAASIVDSAGSSGEANQVLTAGTGGVITWAAGLPSGLYFRTINNRLEYNFGGVSWGTIYDTLFYPIDSNMQVVRTIDTTTSGSYDLSGLTGINAVYIDYNLVGGGGAGGGYNSSYQTRGGNGGNGYTVSGTLPVPIKTSDTTLTWVIGAGGEINSGNDGYTGQSTSINVLNTSNTINLTAFASGGQGGKRGPDSGNQGDIGANGAGGTAGNSIVGGGGTGATNSTSSTPGVTGGAFIQIRSAGYTRDVVAPPIQI